MKREAEFGLVPGVFGRYRVPWSRSQRGVLPGAWAGVRLFLICLFCFPASAYEKVISFDGGDVRCTIRTAGVKTSDFVRLELQAEVTEGVKVVFPKSIRAKNFTMIDRDLMAAEIIDGERVRVSAMYVFEALLPGKQTIPEQKVQIRIDGKKRNVVIPPIPITVESRLANADADILDIEPEPGFTSWIAIACLGIVVVFVIVLVALRARRDEDELTVVAQSLKRLSAMRTTRDFDVTDLRLMVQDCLAGRLGLSGRSASREELSALCRETDFDAPTIEAIEVLLIALERGSYSRETRDCLELIDLCESILPSLEREETTA